MGKIIDAIKDARARQVNDTVRRVAPSMANKDIPKTTSNQRDRENSQRYNYAERAELRKSEQASQTTPQQNNAAAQERGRKQTEYAKQSTAAREKQAARLKANRYTQEANDLDNEGRAKADVYVDGIYMGTDQEVLNEYGRQANAKRELAAQQQAIADRVDTDEKRDGLLKMYETALKNENDHMDFSDGTDKAAKEAYAEATRQREHIEDLIKDKNRELGNDTYAGIDELGRQYLSGARTRDAAQRLEGGRVANYQALAGTAAEWLDDKRQKLDLWADTSMRPSDVQQGALGKWGEETSAKAQDTMERAEQNWDYATGDMSDAGKFAANIGLTVADTGMDAAINMIVPGGGRLLMGARAAGGGAMTQATREKNDVDSRMAKAFLDGGVAYLSEWIGGGAEAAYGKSLIGSMIGKWANAKGLGRLSKVVLNTEGLEEGIEYGLGYIGDRILGLVESGDSFWSDWDNRELAENVIVGYLVGCIFNGVAGGEEYPAKRIEAIANEIMDNQVAEKIVRGEMTQEDLVRSALATPDPNVKIGGQKAPNAATADTLERAQAEASGDIQNVGTVVTTGTEEAQRSGNELIAKIQDRKAITPEEARQIARDPGLRAEFEKTYSVDLEGKGDAATQKAIKDAVEKTRTRELARREFGDIPDARPGFAEPEEGPSKSRLAYEKAQQAKQDIVDILSKDTISKKDVNRIMKSDLMWEALQDATGLNLSGKGKTAKNIEEAFREAKGSLRDVDAAETLSDVATGKPAAQGTNSQPAAESATEAGLNRPESKAAKKPDTPRAKRGSGTVSYDGGTLDGEDYAAVDRSSLTLQQKNQIAALEKLAEATGINITFFQSKPGEDGKLRGANGAYKDGTVYLDVNAGLSKIMPDGSTAGQVAIIRTAGHELTHFIQEFNESDYNNIRDYMVKMLSDKTGVEGLDALIAEKQRIAEKNGHNLSRARAVDEIIADGCEMMLKDSAAVETLAKQNRSLAYKIRRWIKQWTQKIQDAFQGVDAKSKEAKLLADEAKKIQKMWDDALTKAAKAQGIDPKTELYKDGPVQTSIETLAETKDADGEGQYNIRAFEHDEDDYRKMLKLANWSDEKINELFDMLDTVDATINEHLEALDYDTDEDIDDRVFAPVKKNSDKLYKVSQDFSTLCRKRVLQGIIVGELSAVQGRGLTKEEGIVVRDALIALQEEGKQIEVACALCYVESARMRSQAAINRFLDDREAAMQDFYAKKFAKKEITKADTDIRAEITRRAKNGTLDEIGLGDIDVDSKGRIKGRGDDDTYYDITKKKSVTLDDLPPKVKAKIQEATKAARARYRLTDKQQAVVKEANSLPVTLFTTAEGIETLKKEHPDVWGAYNQMVSAASKSKGIEADTWWRAGDSKKISPKLIADMNRENGLRTQSWSDFQVKHLMDYIAATIELSTRGAKQHAYTKVLDYVDLMGNTGVMINMSLIPTREFNGKLEYDNVEGINFKEAMKMRDKYPDTAGTICIGMNTEQIHQLLESTDIDYVIPYHISGMSAETRELMHIPLWENFQDWQNEKKVSGKAAEDNAKKYGVKLLSTDDPLWHKAPNFSDWYDLKAARAAAKKYGKDGEYGIMTGGYKAMQEAADKYAKICAERGLKPKFSYGDTDYSSDPNYWKLLIDRKMVNNKTGEMIEQKPLQPNFELKTINRILNDEIGRYANVKADQEEAARRVKAAWESGKLKEGMKSDEIAKVMHEQQDTFEDVSTAMANDEARHSDRDDWDEGYRTNIENSERLAQEVREYLADHDVNPEEIEEFGVDHFPSNPRQNITDAGNALNMISDLSMGMTGKKRTEAFELMEGLLQRMGPVEREKLVGEGSKNPAFAKWYSKKHPSLYYKGYKPGDLMTGTKPKRGYSGTNLEGSGAFMERETRGVDNMFKEVDHLRALLDSDRLTAEDRADAQELYDRLIDRMAGENEEVFYSDRDNDDERAEKNRAYNDSKTETGSSLKTLNGSAISRGGSLNGVKYPVGKIIGGRIYFHKNYTGEIEKANPEFKADLARAEQALRENYPDFQYNCLNYTPETGMIQFQEAPGFDTEREPVVGKQVNVSKDGTVSGVKNFGQIWHHKWLWVGNDYNGFDVDKSWNWSKQWLSTIQGASKGGSLSAWNKQLGEFGLPEDGGNARFSNREELMNEFSFDDDNAEMPVQEHDSKDTSINEKKLPATFNPEGDKSKWVHFTEGGTNVDVGGGKFDNATEFLNKAYGVKNFVLDPYNRSHDWNKEVVDYLHDGNRADTVTCNNVLNVIKEKDVRSNVILECAKAMKPDGVAYFLIYEGTKDDQARGSRLTNKGWQNFWKAEAYEDEIKRWFDPGHVVRHGNLIVATRPKENLPKAFWQLDDKGAYQRFSDRDVEPDEAPKAEAKKEAPKRYRPKGAAEILAEGAKPRAPKKVLSEGTGEQKVSQYYSNTMTKDGSAKGVPPITYGVKSESQSLANAATRLKKNYRGMIKHLITAEAWSGEMTDAAALVAQELRKDARRTGDKTAYNEWKKIQSAKQRESARGIQAVAKQSRPGSEIMLSALTAEIAAARQANVEAEKAGKTKEIIPEEILKKAETKANSISDRMLDLEIEIDDNIEKGMSEQEAKELTKDRYLDLIDEINAFRHTGLIQDAKVNEDIRNNVRTLGTEFRQKLSEEGIDYIQRFAACDAAGIAEDIHYKGKQDFLKRLNTWQKLAQLTGTGTWGRNGIGNGSFGVVDTLANNSIFTRLADSIVKTKTGKRSTGFEKGILNSKARDAARHALNRSVLEIAANIDLAEDGQTKYDMGRNRTYDPDGKAIDRMISRWEQWNGYMLESSDAWFKGMAAGSTEEAVRRANKWGDDNLTEEERARLPEEEAEKLGKDRQKELDELKQQVAKYRTFQNDGVSAEAANEVRDWLNKKGAKLVGKDWKQGQFGLGTALMPYTKVPTNIGVKPLEFSPIGAAKGLAEMIKVMNDPNATMAQQNKAVTDFGRGMTGTMLIALLAGLMKKAPWFKDWEAEEDKDVKAQNKAEGKSGIQVNWSMLQRAIVNGDKDATWQNGDNVVDISSMEPVNQLLTTASLIAEGMTARQALFQSAKDNLMGLPSLQALSNIENSIKYTDTPEDGWATLLSTAGSTFGSVAGGMLPAPLRHIGTAVDPYARDTSADTAMGRAWNQTLSSIPGFRKTLGRKTDAFGNDVRSGGVGTRFANQYLPFKHSQINQTDESRELARIREETGENYMPARTGPKTVQYGSGKNAEKITLTSKERKAYKDDLGQDYQEQLRALINSEYYKNADDGTKAAMIAALESYSRDTAKVNFADDHDIEYAGNYANVRELDDPNQYLGIRAGFTTSMTNEDYSSVDSLLKSANSLSETDRAYMKEHTDNFTTFYDLSTEGVKAKSVARYQTALKKRVSEAGKKSANGYDIFQTVVEEGFSDREADAFMNRTKSDGSFYAGKGRHAVYEAVRAAGGTPEEALELWDVMDKNANGTLTKKEFNAAIKKIPKERRAAVSRAVRRAMGW